MRWLGREQRGATAVIMAILLVAMIGFTAVAVDVGAAWWDRKQLQNGADAAALAIAQACAGGTCGNANATAQDYAVKNKNDAQANGTATVDSSAGTVTARTTATRQHWFAPVLGITSTDVSAQAKASWGYPFSGATIPLAFSLCEFWWQTGAWSGNPPASGTPIKIMLMTKEEPSGTPIPLDCGTQAAHNETSGGFGWLVPSATTPTCVANASADGWVASDTGSSPPCALNLQAGQVVQVPLFYEYKGNGSNAQYHIKGFAAIKVAGWCFQPNSDEFNSDGNCSGSNRHLRGTFVSFVDLNGMTTSPTAPNFGDAVVSLIG